MMPIQLTLLTVWYFIAGVITLLLAIYTWRIQSSRGALEWSLALIFTTVYIVGSGLEVIFTDPILKWRMIPIIYCGIAGTIYFWVLFSIRYTQHDGWLTTITRTILAIIPVTTFCLTLFLDYHQLIYRDYTFIEQHGLILSSVVEYGIFFYIWALYAYGLLFISLALILQYAWRYPNLFQGQASAVFISMLIPIFASILYTIGINPLEPLDPTPFSIVISGIVMVIGISEYQFLRLSPVAYRVIFDHMVNSVIIIDGNDQITNINPVVERVFKQPSEQIIGQSITRLIPDFQALSQQSSQEGKIQITLNGAPYELRITAIKSSNRQLGERIVLLYDISHRMQIEHHEIQLAVEQERVDILRQFISNVSHDLKTPLSTMKTSHYLLHREFGDNPKIASRLITLDRQADRLIKMVDDMLLMVRLDEDDETTLEATDLNLLIQAIVDTHPIPDGHTIQFEPDKQLPLVNISSLELTQALRHLLSNALINTLPNELVKVSIGHNESQVSINIRDDGSGIPVDDLPYIFDRFYRVDKARNSATGSSGLGLAIVKRIIERHGGTIEVESILGKGSQFTIRLPAIVQES